MPRPRRDFSPIYPRLSDAADDAISAIANRDGVTRSDVVDRAIASLLDASDEGAEGVHLHPVVGRVRPRRFNLSVEVRERLDVAAKRHGLPVQTIVRTAIIDHTGTP